MMISRPVEMFGLQAKLFRGLSDHSRLAILEALCEGPLAVGQIVEKTGLTQSNTSNHLKCLSECGLVASEQEGRFVYYRLADPRIELLLGLADELLADAGRRIYACTNYETAPTAQLEKSRKRKTSPKNLKSLRNSGSKRRRAGSRAAAK